MRQVISRAGSRRRLSPQRRSVLLGGVLTAVIGLIIGIIAAWPLAEPTVVAEGPALAHAMPATAAHQEIAGESPSCRKDPAAPAAPLQAGIPHREDLRVPLPGYEVPTAVTLGRSTHADFEPVDTTGPPSPALALTTVLRI